MTDPTVLLLYKAALGAIILLCAVGAIYGLSRLGSAQGISGIRGFVAWAVADGKSYGLAIVGFVATAAYAFDYLSWDRWIIVMGFVNGTAIGTLRATQGKTINEARTAAVAAEEAAGLAATTQQTIKAAVQSGPPAPPPRPVDGLPLERPVPVPKPRED